MANVAGAQIQDLSIALEPAANFGNLPAAGTEQIPQDTLTHVPFEVQSANFIEGQTEPSHPVNISLAGPGPYPDVIDTVRRPGGAKLRRRFGDVTLTMPARGLVAGGNFTRWDNGANQAPLGMIMHSGMTATDSGAFSDAVLAPLTADTFTPTVVGNYVEGGLIAVDIDGIREWSTVTGVDAGGNVIHHAPRFSRALTNVSVDTVFLATTFSHAVGGIGTLGQSVSMAFNVLEERTIMFGGRLASWKLGPVSEDDSTLMVEAVVRFAHARDEGVVGITNPTRDILADYANVIGCPLVLSVSANAGIGTTPAALAKAALAANLGWSVNWDNDLQIVKSQGTVLASSEWMVGPAHEVTAELVAQPSALFDTSRLDEEIRILIMGGGPARSGQGIAVALMGAHLTSPPLRDPQSRTVQPLAFRAGAWDQDGAISPAFVAPGNTMARIGLLKAA